VKNEKYDKWHDLNKGSFEPYYQPIININDGTFSHKWKIIR